MYREGEEAWKKKERNESYKKIIRRRKKELTARWWEGCNNCILLPTIQAGSETYIKKRKY